MTSLARAIGMLSLVALATPLAAQGPGRPPGGGGPAPMMMPAGPGGSPIGATADFLLSHTGDLALTDAQVVKLAAISRRTQTRRNAMMARMDSARTAARPAPGDSVRGRGNRPAPPSTAQMQQARDQLHNDIRDAIAVLTPYQQATAWMMVAARASLGGAMLGRGGPGPRAPRDVPRRPDGGDDRSQP